MGDLDKRVRTKLNRQIGFGHFGLVALAGYGVWEMILVWFGRLGG